ncbi:MAG: esterase/lipase family protein [Sandaracinaceae bacterium]
MRAPISLGVLIACALTACSGAVDPSGDASTDASRADSGDVSTDAGRDDAGPPPIVDAGTDAGPPRLGPPYPIVLCHGFFGFDDFAGAGFLSYFYGVRDDLAANGETNVFTPAVDPFNDSTARGEELIAHIEMILAMTGHERVNLIGHSQGGLDARYVASHRPDLVASVTTFATPHRGSPIADVVLGLVSDPRAQDLADAIVRVIGAPLYDAAGNETSVFAALRQFSVDGSAAFNAATPDDPSVAYYSLSGRTDLSFGGSACRTSGAPSFISRYDTNLDPVDPLLDLSEQIVDGGLVSAIPNDGLVRVEDAQWGRFLGCVPADHMDEVGQIGGDSPGFGNPFDHLALFRDLVTFLRSEGF